MASWTAPVYDRAYSDIVNDTAKGVFNASDLNRVEQNMEYLADAITLDGVTVVVDTDYTWVYTDSPDVADSVRVISNLDILLGAITMPTTAPKTPTTLSPMNWTVANNLEELTYLVYDLYEGVLYNANLMQGGVLSMQGGTEGGLI